MEETFGKIKDELQNYDIEIEEAFDEILECGIQDDVECFDIEIFFDPAGDLSLTLYSTDGYDEVFKNKDNMLNEFAGSKVLIKNMDLRKYKLSKMKDSDYDDLSDMIFETLKGMLENQAIKVDIPVYLLFHDSTMKFDLISDEWIDLF